MSDKKKDRIGLIVVFMLLAMVTIAAAGGFEKSRSVRVLIKAGVGDTTAAGDTYVRGGENLLQARFGAKAVRLKAILQSSDDATLGWGLSDTASLYVVSEVFGVPETLGTANCAACPCTLDFVYDITDSGTVYGDINLIWFLSDTMADSTITFDDRVRVNYELIARD